MKQVDEAAAFAGLAVLAGTTAQIYRESAPSLADLRTTPPGDFQARQLLLDADILVLIMVGVLGGAGSLLIRRWYPILIASAVALALSGYHRAVLRSATPQDVGGD